MDFQLYAQPMPPKLKLLLITLLFQGIPLTALACEQPNLECLKEHINKQGERLRQRTPHLSEAAEQHWKFESQGHYLPTSTSSTPTTIRETLELEEKIIASIQQGDIDTTKALGKHQTGLFHDLLSANSNQLLMQHLILNLQDQRAEQIKREQLEIHWQSGKPPAQLLMNIARHEILGGDPRTGIATLTNAKIDGFSNVTATTEQVNLQQLGETAEKLFLDPTSAQKNCSEDSKIMLNSVNQFLSESEEKLTTSIWNTPNIQQAWKAHLTLALLYKNAGSCELLVSLHLHQVIMSAINYRPDTEQDFIGLIYLLRTIRRYLS